MVLKKREYNCFNGFHVPFVPRAPRSAHRRRGKKVDDSQICAFELLASLAGKLLQDNETSSASSNASESYQPAVGNAVIKHEQDEVKPLKTECLDEGSYEENVFIPDFPSPSTDQKFLLKESVHGGSDSILENSSVITNAVVSDKFNGDVKSVHCKNKVENGSPDFGGSYGRTVENSFSRQNGGDGLKTGGFTINGTRSSKDPIKLCNKVPASCNSNNNELLSCRDTIPNASILRLRNCVKFGIRDDDENFSRHNKPISKPKACKPASHIGDQIIRKLLTSKNWKVAPKLKDLEVSKSSFLDGGMKSLYCKRKPCYNRNRYQRDTLYKRRKFSDRSLFLSSDGGFSSESVCNSPEKANGVSSSLMGHQASFLSKDSHVKFNIKSFRVPELFIDVPETATVGLLKRTVMDAVTAILGGGLHVGVLLHGKKVRDDNRTLSQTGITAENLDTLGFSLEPSLVQAAPSVYTDDLSALVPCDISQTATRSPATSALDSETSEALADPPPLPNTTDNIDGNHEHVSCHTDILTDITLLDSRALVPVPSVSAEAFAMVPVDEKSRRSELVQRRTRRPFSVSEVEALVQAVEEFGTGRWRDVKLRSFEDADHRTYVDLKDKWKTLVHTAKIAPQQRRGEPVPQELLDRVLAAHAYWSQYQAKQHGKNQAAAILKITDASAILST